MPSADSPALRELRAAAAAEGNPRIVGNRARDGGAAPGGGAGAMVGEADGVPQRPVMSVLLSWHVVLHPIPPYAGIEVEKAVLEIRPILRGGKGVDIIMIFLVRGVSLAFFLEHFLVKLRGIASHQLTPPLPSSPQV